MRPRHTVRLADRTVGRLRPHRARPRSRVEPLVPAAATGPEIWRPCMDLAHCAAGAFCTDGVGPGGPARISNPQGTTECGRIKPAAPILGQIRALRGPARHVADPISSDVDAVFRILEQFWWGSRTTFSRTRAKLSRLRALHLAQRSEEIRSNSPKLRQIRANFGQASRGLRSRSPQIDRH